MSYEVTAITSPSNMFSVGIKNTQKEATALAEMHYKNTRYGKDPIAWTGGPNMTLYSQQLDGIRYCVQQV